MRLEHAKNTINSLNKEFINKKLPIKAILGANKIIIKVPQNIKLLAKLVNYNGYDIEYLYE